MAVEVSASVGLDVVIGSVPVALTGEIDTSATGTTLVFGGFVTGIEIALGRFIGSVADQLGLTATLPSELNLDAGFDYIAAQARHQYGATPTTQVSLGGRFTLTTDGTTVALDFYCYFGDHSGDPFFAFGTCFDGSGLDLARLPVVGSIPAIAALSVKNVGFSYASTPSGGGAPTYSIPVVTKSDEGGIAVYAITDLGTPTAAPGPGFALMAQLIDNATVRADLSLPLTTKQSTSAVPQSPPSAVPVPGSTFAGAPTQSSGPIRWIDINKTLGPVTLRKIGVDYADGEASFGISAGLALAAFTLDLDGLAIEFPLPLPGRPAGSRVAFDLAGLSFDLTRGALQIGAGFLRVDQGGYPAFYGSVIAKISSFGISAVGGYTPAHDNASASFFLYANVTVPLGGPPFLFVTGFAGGFGINKSLILPTLDTLGSYPLLPANAPPQGATPQDTLASVIPTLAAVFADQPGQYWVAAGISFTSFEMIDAFALVTVAFGVDLQVALLGSCAMTFPKGSPAAVAYIQINLAATFIPSSGQLAVIGELTPASNLFDGLVKITGGFAFYLWFSGPHHGDFVVSVGGYHPSFVKPDHYPAVPRLTIQSSLGPLSVTGSAYFALTPAMMMAGLALEAVWQSGGIRAWFDAGVDFLIAWAPFHYLADAYVSIGCSVDLGLFSIDVQVGADLQVWGPPFGGRAEVDLDIVTFTISFGAEAAPVPPVGWQDFRTALLPSDTVSPGPPTPAPMLAAAANGQPPQHNLVAARVASGLLSSDAATVAWVVDPETFSIVTNSAIPATTVAWNDPAHTFENSVAAFTPTSPGGDGPILSLPPDGRTSSATAVWAPVLGVRPMAQVGVDSIHFVTLNRMVDGVAEQVNDVLVQPVLLDVASAMWSSTSAAAVNEAPVVPCALVGLRIQAIPRRPASVRNVPLSTLIFQQGNDSDFTAPGAPPPWPYTAAVAETAAPDPATCTMTVSLSGAHEADLVNTGYVLSELGDAWVSEQRAAMAADLANVFGTRDSDAIDVTLAATETKMTDWPGIARLADAPLLVTTGTS